MKKKLLIGVIILLVAFLMFWLILPGAVTKGAAGNVLHLSKINEMAEYLNEKYGCSLTIVDCTYFMEENYSADLNMFGYGSHYDVPNVAAFNVDGSQVIVTDRNGYISDNGQLDHLNSLLCEYYMTQTGLSGLEFVEIRDAGKGTSGDKLVSDILQKHCNTLITSQNVDEFLQAMWDSGESVEIIFYFRESEDRQCQIEHISRQLGVIDKPDGLRSLKFYTVRGEKQLDITCIRTNLNTLNDRNEAYSFSFGCDYVVNPHELQTWGMITEDSFGYKGCYVLNRGYDGGFGKYTEYTFKINGCIVADLLQ